MKALIGSLALLVAIAGCGERSSPGDGEAARSVAAHVAFPSDRPDIVLTLRPDVSGPEMRDLLTERLIGMDGVVIVEGDYASRLVRVTVDMGMTPAQRDALREGLAALPEFATD